MKTYYCTTIMLSLIFLSGCQSNGGKQERSAEPVKVKTQRIIPVPSNSSLRFSGTVEEASATLLSFPVMGTIKRVYVSLGNKVSQGQLIAELDSSSMKNSYEAAHATAVQAEDAFQRMKKLYDKGSLPEIRWTETRSKLQQAKAMEELAMKNLKDCKLYSPYSGVIAEKNMEAGQNVMPGVPIGKLVSTGTLKVKIAVPETEISTVTTGNQAIISVPALNGQVFSGTVTEKGIIANPLSRSYEVKIQVSDVTSSLMPGMVTEVMLKDNRQVTHCIVPVSAVQTDEQNRSFVWINQQGKAKQRFIECGSFTANGITVISGIDNGEEIIVEGQQKVCNGTEITIEG